MRDEVKNMVISYNKKNTVTAEKAIIAKFTVEQVKAEEKVKEIRKTSSRIKASEKLTKSKKELTLDELEGKKELSSSERERLEKLLAKHKKTEVKNKTVSRRRGEH
jgi:hypothetical protein